jgi:membrane protease YdiL (CAAX protease family)
MFFADLIQQIQPTFLHIVFYSFCASVGEEILFRGGIQPFIGIWPASLLFVFLHGYINPSNMNLTVYGVFLIIICAGFGYLFKFFGIGSCIMAHFVYDVFMFSLLRYSARGDSGDIRAGCSKDKASCLSMIGQSKNQKCPGR